MFGIFMALIGGIGRAGYSISQALDDDKYREEARRAGRPYYFAHDGERRVSDNHKIARGAYGIIDATTGDYIVDKRELERQKDREFEEENRVSKQEAIIKGENTYSWKKRTGNRSFDYNYCLRLVSNDMPAKEVSGYIGIEWFPGKKELTKDGWECKYGNKPYDDYIKKEKKRPIHHLYKEVNFEFLHPMQFTEKELQEINERISKTITYTVPYCQVPDEGWVKIVEACKKKNIESLVKKINIYPINEIKWMHQYCFKYGIPMGTWEEVEAACWEEHPVKWGKPACETWELEQFVKGKF